MSENKYEQLMRELRGGQVYEDDTRMIVDMTEDELQGYRVIATKHRLHLIPRDQDGVPVEKQFGSSAIAEELRGARIFTTRHGEQIISRIEDD